MYTYNNAYRFLIHKSNIENIHLNTIMDSRNAIFFKDVFLFKQTQEIHSLKRT
jgi:catechol-2,3-dioxygenase